MVKENIAYCRPRILVVENDTNTRLSFIELLNFWQYETFFVEGSGSEIIQQAINFSKSHRCHLALLDMRLLDNYDPKDYSGLELIKELSPTICIVTSAYGDANTASLAIKDKGAYAFFVKGSDPEILRNWLEKASQEICAASRQLNVIPPTIPGDIKKILYPDNPEIHEDQVSDVFARLYPHATELNIEILKGPEVSSLSTVPRPRSRILLVKVGNKQPDLVKIARAEKIRKEVDRYKEFVEGRLVGNFNPPMKNHEILWDLGGTIYPFIGTERAVVFSEAFQTASYEKLELGLDQFFLTTWSDLYEQRTSHPKSLFAAYNDVWGIKWFENKLYSFDPPKPYIEMPHPWNLLDVPEPVSWLKNRVKTNIDIPITNLAVTHGDLHGDNMLLDDDGHVWVIDFERTGFGPLLQDIVELETDIIDRLVGLPESDFRPYFEICVWACKSTRFQDIQEPKFSDTRNMDKAIQVISLLRRIAREINGESDCKSYYWGLLLNTLFRVSLIKSDKSKKQTLLRSLMFASILCHRLEHWEETWPPPEWPCN